MIGLRSGKFVLWVAFMVAFGSTGAKASVACSVLATDGEKAAKLYLTPALESPLLREVPMGDLVLYPQADLAPSQADGWAWVRHDPSQKDIWQSGDFGWIPEDRLTDCG